MEKLLLRPAEAGDLIGVGRSKVYALLKAHALPTVRIGKNVRIPLAALREWVAAKIQDSELDD